MKKIIAKVVATVVALTFGTIAHAYSVSPSTPADWQGSAPKNPDASDVACITDGDTYNTGEHPSVRDDFWENGCEPTGDLYVLYKENVGDGFDTGDAAWLYETTFNAEDGPSAFDIDWLGTEGSPAIDCSEGCYLLVKDGNNDPIWYLFDISDWDGMESINGSGFWPEQGGISHVTIFGGIKVPEPGTLALMGLGLFAIGLMRRRQIRR